MNYRCSWYKLLAHVKYYCSLLCVKWFLLQAATNYFLILWQISSLKFTSPCNFHNEGSTEENQISHIKFYSQFFKPECSNYAGWIGQRCEQEDNYRLFSSSPIQPLHSEDDNLADSFLHPDCPMTLHQIVRKEEDNQIWLHVIRSEDFNYLCQDHSSVARNEAHRH